MNKDSNWLHFEGAAFTVWETAPALGLVEGDMLLCRPSAGYVADNVYLTKAGEPVIVGLTLQSGVLFLIHGDGLRETFKKPEVDSRLAAFVTRTIPNPAYHGPR